MGRQSSRIYFNGQDHKEIYFNGSYHNAMYIGSQLVWEKLESEYGTNKLHRILDYSEWNGVTYCIISIYNYDSSTKTSTYEDTYIGKFNTQKMCIDILLSGFLTGNQYDSYYIYACKDGLVLIEYDSKYTWDKPTVEPTMRIAKYPISKNTSFKGIGKGKFTEDTSIYTPPMKWNIGGEDVVSRGEYVVFASDYVVREIPFLDADGNSIRAVISKYDYDGNLIAQTTPTDYVIDGARQTTFKNVFPLNGAYVSYTTTYNGANTSRENLMGIVTEKGLLSTKKQVIESSGDDYYQKLNINNMNLTRLGKKRVMVHGKNGIIFSAYIYPESGVTSPYATLAIYMGSIDGIKRVNNVSADSFAEMSDCILAIQYSENIVYAIYENEVKHFATGYNEDYLRRQIWFAEDDNNYYRILEGYDSSRSPIGNVVAFDKKTLEVKANQLNKIRYLNK